MERVRTVLWWSLAAVCAAALAGVRAAAAAPAGSATTAGGAPDSFFVRVSAAPLLLQVSAPAALPFEIEVGLGYSSIKLDNAPLVVSEAGPVHLPLLSALGLLGGAESLGPLIQRLLPDILVGLPKIVGLERFPFDPSRLPIPRLEIPALPELFCTSFFPGDPREEQCSLPSARAFGFELGPSSGVTRSTGEASRGSSVATEASTTFGGLARVPSSLPFPLSVGELSSSSAARVEGGRVVAEAELAIGEIDLGGAVRIPPTTARIEAALGGTADTATVSQQRCTLPPGAVPAATSAGRSGGREGRAGALAGLDLGSGELAHSVGAEPEISADGTSLRASSACLDGSWSIPTSGTRIRFMVGAITLEMSAERDATTPPPAPSRPSAAVRSSPEAEQMGALGPLYAGFMALTFGAVAVASLLGGHARPGRARARGARSPRRSTGPRRGTG